MVKLNIETPWGQLPLLEVDGEKTVAQSFAILRFVAKKCDLYSDDHLEAACIDEYAYSIGELYGGEYF